MSLYYEAATVLTSPTNAGGSLKSRIFGGKDDVKSPPAQMYALVIETCKWSSILKEIIEHASLLTLERKLTPVLSLLLVHDLLLAKKGVALPASHGLRLSVERHKARLQAELTRARIRRAMGSMEALTQFVEAEADGTSKTGEAPHPRWIRINTLKTQLEDQLETTFAGLERADTVSGVRQRGVKRIYIDAHIPNLVAVPASLDLTKSDAYATGAIIFQDKASCFPAYLLDPLPEDGDVMDTCAAPGNKTTHLAAILLSHAEDPEECPQKIHAFEKNKARAETLKKMVDLAGSTKYTPIHAGQDFLRVDPQSASYKDVGALLLDPSCSGSGIIGRDDMPELHLPSTKPSPLSSTNPRSKARGKKGKEEAPGPAKKEETLKRKRDAEPDALETMVDDDGLVTAVSTTEELATRLQALSSFQLSLVLHAMTFPSARKITYSTCSVHAAENESVILGALASPVAQQRGWRILERPEQMRGLRDWPVRGSVDACDGDAHVAEACIRADKGDEHATMGFFVAAFVRDRGPEEGARAEALIVRDAGGFIVRDVMGFPVTRDLAEDGAREEEDAAYDEGPAKEEEEDEWAGFGDDDDDDTSVARDLLPSKAVANGARASKVRPSLLSGGSMAAGKRKKKKPGHIK
ncbi:MAG: hypothetical protein M1818_007566 [Claussenomyces sp. TS43310]|nr:MAG: hypothetical protein M1818_007566 [Claussenomyces sp. TS43310]